MSPADAIVIERSTLPEVLADRDGFHADGLLVDIATTAADAMQDARAHLAIAEYLRTHPPVDEAEVERLARALRDKTHGAVIGGATWEYAADQAAWIGTARRLYLAGVRAPEVTE